MKKLTIESLSVRAAKVPLPEPHRTATAVISESPLVFIDITASDGSVGHALLFTYTPVALIPTAAMVDNMRPLLEGQVLAPKSLAADLAARFKLLGKQGVVGMALAGIDMALWDCLARSQNLSLVHLLGGESKAVKPYGAVGFDGQSGSALTAEKLVADGFLGVKAKIGYATVEEDIQVIRAMRNAVGNDIAIMVDYNQSLDAVEAMRRLQHLDEEGLTWVEEPVSARDYRNQATLSAASATPIQCGENWWGIEDMQLSLSTESTNLVMPDVMKIGGITSWLDAAALASAYQIPMSTHLWSELSARLLCITPTADWLEYCDWWNPVIKNPLVVENGYTKLDDNPGTGVQWNEKMIEKYLI